jgi:hypothetical protein
MTAKHSNPTCNRNMEQMSVEEIIELKEFQDVLVFKGR